MPSIPTKVVPKPTAPTRSGSTGSRRPRGAPRPAGRPGRNVGPSRRISSLSTLGTGSVHGGGIGKINLAPSEEPETDSQPQRGGRIRRSGQQAKIAAGAAKGATKGAVKGGIKGAKRGAKVGGTVGKGVGAGAGAAVGSVVPGYGTAAGAKFGAQAGEIGGKITGGAAGAGAGAGIGAAQGARQGAADAKAKIQAKQGNKPEKSFRQRAGEKLEDKSIKVAAQLGSRSTGIPAPLLEKGIRLAYKAEKIKRKFFLIIIIGVIAGFFMLFFFLSGGAEEPASNTTTNGQTNPISVTVTCVPPGIAPNLLKVGDTSVCTISVTDSQSADDLTVVATTSPYAQYVTGSANPAGGTYDAKQDTVTWDAKKLKQSLTAPISLSYTLTVKVITPYKNTQNAQGAPIVATVNGTGGASSCTATGSPDEEAKWQQVLKLGQQYGPLWITFLNDARSIAQQQDYPLAVIVGQGGLESAHGTSNFAQTRNNFFGFDAFDNNVNAAKTYPNPAASILDYVNLIKGGNGGSNQLYLQAYADRANPVEMVQMIKNGGYATDPNYVSEVTSIQEFQILEGVSLPCN